MSSLSYQLLRLWPFHKAGALYAAGGSGDQPNIYLDAMDLLAAFFAAPPGD